MSNVTRVEEVYLAATQRTDPAERAAFLDVACGADPDLRRRVEELLAAHPRVGRFLEPPPDATHSYLAADSEASLEVGQLIDERYKLLERIGEGGMGEVWVADQLAPVRRRVAVKLIKPGMDSRGVLARFEAERQALAVMDHPNIAKVLDAGTTADGRPYFVMELVKGTPITEFADARKLTPRERLALFVPVCHAIQHAHQKGVIHRDIKPSNVLVELHDDQLVPKVIDFGVAKAVGQPLTEKTIYTGLGALVGTPAYMAPEQATFNALDIDTRADVYALGVLLYELLAGSPPVESERLKKAALDEVLRLVREEEPPRPSQRLSTSEAKASIAAVRGSDPGKLSALMRGELDWIVMKALEKDRSRRYDTATALAKDVQRYINGDAVEACPPTLGYRLWKAYRRNRAAVLVGTAFAVLLLAGASVASVLAVQARRAEMLARANEHEAQVQRREAEDNKNAWLKVSESYMEAAIDAEIRSTDARLDADLLEYKADARVGLLRLARPLKDTFTIPAIGPNFHGTNTISLEGPEFVKLREFQAAAVIAAGQEFVPLVPPLEAADRLETSPDGRWFLSHTDQGGLVLWSMPSLKRVGLLCEAEERVLRFGFTPDSKTIWTQDVDSIVRFWNLDGTFRAKTPLRPERFVYPAGMNRVEVSRYLVGNSVLVADGVVTMNSARQLIQYKHSESMHIGDHGPTDLYSTRTGKIIRRINPDRWGFSDVKLVAGDRWLIYHEHKERIIELVIVSADDGRELARLDLGVSKNSPFGTVSYSVSLNRQWMMAWQRHQPQPGSDWVIDPKTFQLWRCHDWTLVQDSALAGAFAVMKKVRSVSIYTDDLVGLFENDGDEQPSGWVRIGQPGSWMADKAIWSMGWYSPVVELGGKLFREDRTLFTADPIQRLNPPRGRKYHPDLAKLAPDGRFFENLDTVTEKELPNAVKGSHIAGFGTVGVEKYEVYDFETSRYRATRDPELRILTDPSKLNIPPAMLELWAQVVVGGELTPEGTFQPWDQPTWAAKQKQLAAMKPPYANFPFPGWAPTEPNLWYRIQANRTQNTAERNKLLDEWRRRTGRTRPKPEPDTWRTPGPIQPGPKNEPAPPPRAVK